MDYHNRAGSKKGGGGIATDSQFNRQRRKQIEELLSGDSAIPFTFQENEPSTTSPDLTRQNPYIYKNHSGKLVCKLCNTMHMSWTSVERHLRGKKHGLNVIRRNNVVGGGVRTSGNIRNVEDSKVALDFQRKVETMRQQLNYDAGLPKINLVGIKDPKTDNKGISIRIIYPHESQTKKDDNEEKVNKNETAELITQQKYPPFLRVITGMELSNSKDRNKRFLVISYPPFENVAIEIPSQADIIGGKNNTTNGKDDDESTIYVDDLNRDCTFWDPDSRTFFVQCYFLSSDDKKTLTYGGTVTK